MGFSAALQSKYATTHENRFWNKLVLELKSHYESKSEDFLIAGNFIIDGKQIDAIVIKQDAIVVIDFKDYGGSLEISENGSWLVSGVVINSGRKNPYSQLADNKYGILNTLSRRLPSGYENWINLGHINALVLFHQDVVYDNDSLKNDLSPSAAKWFNISDLKHLCQTLDEITSGNTLITGNNFLNLVSALGLDEIPVYESMSDETSGEIKQEKTEVISPLNKSQDIASSEQPKYSDIYYTAARSLKEIEILIIGQDPYPEGGNGVAFCKSSLYGLYQEGCSGGLVLNSLGYTRQKSFERYKNPEALFYDLLISQGICFTNINHKEFKKLSLEQILQSTKETRDFNIDLVKKSKKIVLLGKGQTSTYFSKLYEGFKPDVILIHPSLNARQDNEKEWDETWTKNTLQLIAEA